ncbi:putative mitochondrial protein, partial [Mucuna pruriens]
MLDSKIVSCYFVGYGEWSHEKCKIHEEVEFGREGNIRNVVYEELVIDNEQVFASIIVQEIDLVINNDVTLDIAQRQDNIEIPPQAPLVVQTQQLQEDDIALTEENTINFSQAIQSFNSKKWIDAMNDEIKLMFDNDIWDIVKLPEDVKLIGFKSIFKTKGDSKGNVERYKVCLVAKGFTKKEDIDYKENFSSISLKDSLRTIMTLSYIRWILPINDITNFTKLLPLIVLRSWDAYFVLGIQILIDHSQDTLGLSQKSYINTILDRFNMKDSKLGDTPIDKGDKFSLK